MQPIDATFTGQAVINESASLLDFWRWAFSDLCDDDLKGIFAEWMVRLLMGLPTSGTRRISWANSDIILLSGKRIEVKASALWQSWKLWNEDGTPKVAAPVTLDPHRVRFGGLQARSAVEPQTTDSLVSFKSDLYVFCMNTQSDPKRWNAWNLSDWEFYVMTKRELTDARIGGSVSLAYLRNFRQAMTAQEFQSHMRALAAQ
jgi:hypothetical protein